jgi:urease accessory protein
MSGKHGNITVTSINGASQLYNLFSTYPLRLMRQENWLDYICIVMIGFGGGFVEGDKCDLSITADNAAKLCVKTQGSTKVFKSVSSKICTQLMRATISDDSILAFLPDPTTGFPDSVYEQLYSIDIHGSASLVLVDWFTAGRANRNEYWDMERLKNQLVIKRDNKILLFENQDVRNDSSGTIAAKVGNCAVFGCVVLVGPKTSAISERLKVFQQRESFEQMKDSKNIVEKKASDATKSTGWRITPELMIAVSDIADQCTLMRFAGTNVEDCYSLLAEVLLPLNEHLVGVNPYQDRLHKSSSSLNNCFLAQSHVSNYEKVNKFPGVALQECS